MTYVNIMVCTFLPYPMHHYSPLFDQNYDVWGSSSTPGPNAPLGNLCGTSTQPQASAQAAVAQWSAAGFPKNKILLGLPLYGYVSKSSKTTLSGSLRVAELPTSNHSQRVLACGLPTIGEASETSTTHNSAISTSAQEASEEMNNLNGAHDRSFEKQKAIERVGGLPKEEVAAGDLSAYWGQQIAFSDIVRLGALKKSGSAYVQANGYTQGKSTFSFTQPPPHQSWTFSLG
jgi:chitinase